MGSRRLSKRWIGGERGSRVGRLRHEVFVARQNDVSYRDLEGSRLEQPIAPCADHVTSRILVTHRAEFVSSLEELDVSTRSRAEPGYEDLLLGQRSFGSLGVSLVGLNSPR